MSDLVLQAVPFKEAISSFESKGYKITFDHREMERDAHAYSFTVAKAMSTDILQDIRTATNDALTQGNTFEEFKKQLKPVLQDKGWWGRQTVTDPATGEQKDVQLGSSRRLKTIYDTNLRTSYAAGRWEQAQRTKKIFPYLRYVATMDDRTRPEHRAWHNVVKPVDDPWWDTHMPPCGWGCRCSVQQVSGRDLERYGLKVTTHDPDGPERTYVNRRTGQTVKVPQGIDPGFAYNPGKARMRALTPPPLDRPLSVPFSGDKKKVPAPEPEVPSAKNKQLEKLPDEEAANEALKVFGASSTKPVVFTDVLGEPQVISRDLFTDAQGNWKIDNGRKPYLLFLMEAIKNPDEIWLYWETDRALTPRLRKRYLKRATDGQNAYVAFDVGTDGWTGVTAFATKRDKYFEDQRAGTLVYRRANEAIKNEEKK